MRAAGGPVEPRLGRAPDRFLFCETGVDDDDDDDDKEQEEEEDDRAVRVLGVLPGRPIESGR